jgi:hypothetical protein
MTVPAPTRRADVRLRVARRNTSPAVQPLGGGLGGGLATGEHDRELGGTGAAQPVVGTQRAGEQRGHLGEGALRDGSAVVAAQEPEDEQGHRLRLGQRQACGALAERRLARRQPAGDVIDGGGRQGEVVRSGRHAGAVVAHNRTIEKIEFRLPRAGRAIPRLPA